MLSHISCLHKPRPATTPRWQSSNQKTNQLLPIRPHYASNLDWDTLWRTVTGIMLPRNWLQIDIISRVCLKHNGNYMGQSKASHHKWQRPHPVSLNHRVYIPRVPSRNTTCLTLVLPVPQTSIYSWWSHTLQGLHHNTTLTMATYTGYPPLSHQGITSMTVMQNHLFFDKALPLPSQPYEQTAVTVTPWHLRSPLLHHSHPSHQYTHYRVFVLTFSSIRVSIISS